MSEHAKIGDLLRQRGRPDAALIEYQRASAAGPYRSPALAGKMARTAQLLGRSAEAREVLKESIQLYPEFGPNLALLAEVVAGEGDWNSAITYGTRGVAQNPFDPGLHGLLIRGYRGAGRSEEVDRHRTARSLLGLDMDQTGE